MKNLIKLFGIAFLFGAIFMACEGPEGPAGEDGVDGVDGTDGTALCMTCHDAGTEYAAKVDQFKSSAHSLGTYYDRGGQCAGCHSTEGFLAMADFTSISDIDNLSFDNQSQISCKTCHMVHVAYDETDWDLTYTGQVTETLFGYSSPDHTSASFDDMGDANMCLNCHQARDRGNVPALASTADVTISTHWGPHYGVQGQVIHSMGGIEITGSASYPTEAVAHDCIRCHMPDGNHNLQVDLDGCTECHSTIEDDFETLQDDVHDMLHELGKSLAAAGAMIADVESEWIWDGTDHVEVVDTTGFHPAGGYGGTDVSADLARAVWNYMVVYQDHSYGVHNEDYIKALLTNTQAMVDGL